MNARDEAERRYPSREPEAEAYTGYPPSAVRYYQQGAFLAGAEWQASQPVQCDAKLLQNSQSPDWTDAEIAAAAEAYNAAVDAYYWPDSTLDRGEIESEDLLFMRAALSAASTARTAASANGLGTSPEHANETPESWNVATKENGNEA
jgi:hypothetical protein